MRDSIHWARLLAFVTALVNQRLLLQNEYLAAENRILRAHLPDVCAFLIPSDRPSLKSASGSARLRLSRSRVSPNPIPSSPRKFAVRAAVRTASIASEG